MSVRDCAVSGASAESERRARRGGSRNRRGRRSRERVRVVTRNGSAASFRALLEWTQIVGEAFCTPFPLACAMLPNRAVDGQTSPCRAQQAPTNPHQLYIDDLLRDIWTRAFDDFRRVAIVNADKHRRTAVADAARTPGTGRRWRSWLALLTISKARSPREQSVSSPLRGSAPFCGSSAGSE